MADEIGTKVSQLPLGENLADSDLMYAVEGGISKKVEVGYLKNRFVGDLTLADLGDDSTHRLVTDAEKTAWSGKQDALTFDNAPTSGSSNPVKSSGIYTALGTKANTSDLATVATTGDYDDLTDKPTIPSDADDISYDNTESGLTATNVQDAIDEVLTEGGKVQDVKVDGVSVVDTNKVAQIDLTGKANTDGTYDGMTVGTALAIKGKMIVTDNAPYVYRSSFAGDSAVDKLIGGTIAWNQLLKPSTVSANGTTNNIKFTTNSDGSVNLNGTATADTAKSFVSRVITNPSHKYLILDANKTSGVYIYNGYLVNGKVSCSVGGILTGTSQSWSTTLYFYINNGTALNNVDVKIMCIDLTQAFGSTIADYVYTLERATAGGGISWLKSYGFLTEDYYAYDSGRLQSVNASVHVMKDSNSQVVGNYPLDSSLTLRGIPKLSNDKMYYDGDTYESDGSVTRKYGTRAYQSGDESLADAITDGTNTVYKLTTPTTESAQPFTNPQVVDADGTEEYVDYGVVQQTRDVAIPVGHDTTYTHEEEIELPLPAPTNGTYTLKATRSASGVNYVWVADA